MTSSADVAAKAGVSRSTVSQILNGHGHRFRPDMVSHVQEVARTLGYRPSLAGRALARGKSDIVVTLLPNISLGPRLRELIDRVTSELATVGKTNLIRLSSGEAELDDAVLDLRPAGLWSVAPLTAEQHDKLDKLGVTVVDQPQELQRAIDHEIGAIQARHLIDCGYPAVAVALPEDVREQPFALAREQGVWDECRSRGVGVLPTLRLDLRRGSSAATSRLLSSDRFAVAAYNDDAALAVLGAARVAGRDVPRDIGIIGVDNTIASGISEPTLTTVDIDVALSAQEIVHALLEGPSVLPSNAFEMMRTLVSVVEGDSTSLRPR